MLRLSVCVTIGLGLTAIPAMAAETEQRSAIVTSLEACRSIQDGAARLECYDRTAASLLGAVEKGNLIVVDREEVGKARRSLFGFPLPNLPFLKGGGKAERDEEPKEFSSTLTAIRSSGVGRYRFTIENGEAVWETVDAVPAIYAKPGVGVKIRRGALGSYFLRLDGETWVRARRVR